MRVINFSSGTDGAPFDGVERLNLKTHPYRAAALKLGGILIFFSAAHIRAEAFFRPRSRGQAGNQPALE